MISLVYPVEEPILSPNSCLSRVMVCGTPEVKIQFFAELLLLNLTSSPLIIREQEGSMSRVADRELL